MTAIEAESDGGADRDEFPTPELECLLDDWDAPSAVTVFCDGADGEWLTIDATYAIDLDTVP